MRVPEDESANDEVTRLLIAWSRGDLRALDQVFSLVFQELRQIARKCHRRLPSEDLQPTELIGEIYAILLRQRQVRWECRGQFYKFASTLMERVLLGYRRSLKTEKRGNDFVRVPFTEVPDPAPDAGGASSPRSPSNRRGQDDGAVFEILATAFDVAEKIAELEQLDPQQAEIVKLRYLIGLSIDETAETLGVSPRTVTRKWKNAKRFLAHELDGYDPD
jgi:RNA polymerase sigma factor (sigma-70 family)